MLPNESVVAFTASSSAPLEFKASCAAMNPEVLKA